MLGSRRVRLGFLGLVALLAAAAPSALAVDPPVSCVGEPTDVHRIEFSTSYGYYALPTSRPRGMVVLAHGSGQLVKDNTAVLTELATKYGVVVIAPEYRGMQPDGRGTPIMAGAEDTNAMTRLFRELCPDAGPTVAAGFSMGVTVTGVAIAGHPTAADGSPLYDYWVFVAGLTDLAEQYRIAQLYGATTVLEDMEAETGGTPDQVPGEYARRSPVNLVGSIAAAGLKGIVGAHSALDTLSWADQGFRLGLGLFLANAPVEGYGVLTSSPASRFEFWSLLPGFAGHHSDTTNTVALDRLSQLLNGDVIRRGLVVVDGMTGLRVPLQDPTGLLGLLGG